MGKALYRKYRSKGFDEVVGQEHMRQTFGFSARRAGNGMNPLIGLLFSGGHNG